MVLAALVRVPDLGTLRTAWEKFGETAVPAPLPLMIAGFGALMVNLGCALALVRYRRQSGSLSRAAFISARNDAFAHLRLLAAGLVTAFVWVSPWPDLLVGLGLGIGSGS